MSKPDKDTSFNFAYEISLPDHLYGDAGEVDKDAYGTLTLLTEEIGAEYSVGSVIIKTYDTASLYADDGDKARFVHWNFGSVADVKRFALIVQQWAAHIELTHGPNGVAPIPEPIDPIERLRQTGGRE